MISRSMMVISVPDLAISTEFCRRALGFDIHKSGDPGWRFYVKDAVHIMAGECPDDPPVTAIGDHDYFCYLVVEDVDAYHRQVSSGGAEIVSPPEDKPWGLREFCLRTVDGHRMVVGETLDD